MTELGYTLADFDLWDGWLILEESSAERIIRDYLIPWFAPKLSRVRTLSAAGVDKVKPTIEDFSRMVRFTHLEHVYRNKAWVRVDGDEVGKKVIERLSAQFPTWKPDRFATYSQEQFENFYPAFFADRIADTLALKNSSQKREAKQLLLEDVRKWLDADESRGKTALSRSALEVITDLREIQQELFGPSSARPA